MEGWICFPDGLQEPLFSCICGYDVTSPSARGLGATISPQICEDSTSLIIPSPTLSIFFSLRDHSHLFINMPNYLPRKKEETNTKGQSKGPVSPPAIVASLTRPPAWKSFGNAVTTCSPVIRISSSRAFTPRPSFQSL